MKSEDFKSFITAIVLSLIVLVGWQYFFAEPVINQQQQQIKTEKQRDSILPIPQDTLPKNTQQQSTPKTVPKINIQTQSVTAEISLQAGRLNTLKLNKYRQTTNPESNTITLLTDENQKNAYYADFGWVTKNNIQIPTPNSIWTPHRQETKNNHTNLTLKWENENGLTFYKTFDFDENYMIEITQEIENNTTDTINITPWGQISRHQKPQTSGFFILHEGPIGVLNDELYEIDYDDLEEQSQSYTAKGGWIGITDKYWATILIPEKETEVITRFAHFGNTQNPIFRVDYIYSEPISIPAGGKITIKNNLFAGAKVVNLIDQYATINNINKFDLLVDWGWFYFITKPTFSALQFFNDKIGNFGAAILLVTIIIKLIFFPLANKSYVAMSHMKRLQPEVEKIRELYGDDKVKMQEQLMALYKKEKVSPASGCLPVIIQIPVFFAIYKVLFVTIEMRHAPFFGWITDLSAPDPTNLFNLFGLIPWDPPQILAIGIWPIFMGITMFFQMRLNPTPPDPIQAKIFTWMPVFFTFLLATFPAGLVIYWAWNNLLSILQQYVIMRQQGVKVDLFHNIRTSLGMGNPQTENPQQNKKSEHHQESEESEQTENHQRKKKTKNTQKPKSKKNTKNTTRKKHS